MKQENFNQSIVQRKYDFTDFDAVFVESFDQYQQKDHDRILNTEHRKSINLWTWKNDKVQAEFAVICAERKLENVTVKASDLVGESVSLPSSVARLSFIKDVKAYTGHAGWYANNPRNKMPKGEREYFPEVIYSDAPVQIDKDKFQLVWMELSIPGDALPGIYHGAITVSAENSDKTVELSYSLEVLNIAMPDPQSYLFDVEYWSHPYNVAYYYGVKPFSDEHMMILKQHMTEYKNLGGHAITASIVEEAWGGQTYGFNNDIHYPSMIKWIKSTDGEWRFDYTHFDKWVHLNREIGIADKIICYSMMPWKNTIRYYDEANKKQMKLSVNPSVKEKYNKVWLPFLNSFISHLDEKGWFYDTYMGFDERRNMETALDLIAAAKNKNGHSLKISASFNDFKHNAAIFNRLDYASVGLQQIRDNLQDFKNQVQTRRDNKKETTLYTATEHVPNSFTKSIPVESYWSILFSGSLNATGFLRWAYDAWVENPLEESTHWSFPSGDCFLVYPSYKEDEDKKSRFSLRLAMLDEGVRDVNKLYLMRELSPKISSEIEKLFAQIKGSEENSYEFYTMKRTNIWGRTAKWLTDNGKKEMIADMRKIKQEIYEISKLYCNMVGDTQI
ncbi:MAG: DUF4091 domain-containing protein [Faecalibacterium sp.]|nr:DUF4091 domain-containing protein [Ruminococcus sp.]MCM1392166.1 DUF4091 domain-containing protein [Ruminococcus sp.]MCM1486030.1 DUF4091 domain-containing protein [Faecalibacterium sp.]